MSYAPGYNRYLKQCSGKRRHRSEFIAYKAKKRMVEDLGLTPEQAKSLVAYSCPICRAWHLGNQPDWVRQLREFSQYAERIEAGVNCKFNFGKASPEAAAVIEQCRQLIRAWQWVQAKQG